MIKNELGNRHGRLVVIASAKSRHGKAQWLCKCDCGNVKIISGDSLRQKRSVSCGCYQQEARGLKNRTHGLTRSPTYRSWQMMKKRCSCPDDVSYKNYGARGITYTPRWEKFQNFLQDMGEKPDGTSLERLNNAKGYSKSNCKWATRTEQNRNRRLNILFMYRKQTKCLAEWCEELNLSYSRTYHRLTNGWSVEAAFETPFVQHKDRKWNSDEL